MEEGTFFFFLILKMCPWIERGACTQELCCTLEVESWETQDFTEHFRKPTTKLTKSTLFRRGNDFILPCLCSLDLSEEPWGTEGVEWHVVH